MSHIVKNFKKVSIVVLFVTTVILLGKVIDSNLSIKEIQNFVSSFEGLGPIIYIIMFTFVPLTLFPDSVLAISSGLIFGFFIVFLLRLIPLFPFDIISYGAGLTSIKYKDYISATFLGTIPGIMVFSNIGAKSIDISSFDFYLSIGALVVLLLSSIILKKVVLDKKISIEKGR